MFRYVIAAVLALAVAKAMAGDLEDGMAAMKRKDYETALTKFRSAAQRNNAAAQFSLGVMYYEGYGVERDYKLAHHWHLLAATKGYAAAQYNLGRMYFFGQGVPQDFIHSHLWFNIAAASGYRTIEGGRELVARSMTSQQIEQAQRMARECMSSNYTKCN